jgi:hypothetical protein
MKDTTTEQILGNPLAGREVQPVAEIPMAAPGQEITTRTRASKRQHRLRLAGGMMNQARAIPLHDLQN